jgi:ribosomal protein S4E
MKNELHLGHIVGASHDDKFVKVHILGMGESQIPKRNVTVMVPKGRGNKVVVLKGEDVGSIGKIESIALKYKGKWMIKEHLSGREILACPEDLAITKLI